MATRTLAVVIAGVAALGALLAVGFHAHVVERDAYLAEHRYRALAALRTQLEADVEAGSQQLRARRRTAGRPPRAAGPSPSEVCTTKWDDAGVAIDLECELGGMSRVDVRAVLSASALREDFDALLLADARGYVLYQVGLDAAGAGDLYALPPERSGIEKQGYDAQAGQNPARPGLPGRYRVARVWMGGEVHQLFCETLDGIRAGRSGTGDGDVHAVCGVVRASRVDAERMEIPWQLAFAIVLALVMMALGVPVVRLESLGPREPLRGWDVKTLVLCCVLGGGLATLLLSALAGSMERTARIDRRLGGLAGEVVDRLVDRVGTGVAKLQRVPDGAAPDAEPPPQDAQSHPQELFLIDADGRVVGAEYRAGDAPVSGPARFAPYERDVWVTDEAYFRQARSAAVPSVRWTTPIGQRGDALGDVAIGVVRSRIKDELVLIVARRVPGTDRVASARLQLKDFEAPIVSKHFGFALVDREGKVLLHSQPRRSLAENLLLEADGSPLLKAALWSQREGLLDVQYRGSPHRLLLRRIPSSTWSLVAFRDTQFLEAAGADRLAAAATLFLIYCLPYLMGAIVVELLRSQYRAAWLWPDRRRGVASYALLAVALAVTAVAARGAIPRDGTPALAALVALPVTTLALLRLAMGAPGRPLGRTLGVVAVAGGSWMVYWSWPRALWWAAAGISWALVLARGRSPRDESRPWTRKNEVALRRAYAAMLLALLGVVAIAPASVLSRDAEALTATELRRLDKRTLASRRSSSASVVQLRAWKNQPPGHVQEAPGPERWLSACVLSRLPAYTQLTADLRATSRSRPCGTWPRAGWSALWLLAVAACALGYWLVRNLIAHVFALDADAPPDGSLRATEPGLRWWTYRRIALQELPGCPAPPLNLARESGAPAIRAFADRPAAPSSPVEIDHLERCLADPALNAMVLDLLESLVRRGDVTVQLRSTEDPIERLTVWHEETEAANGRSDVEGAARLGRWQFVLAAFEGPFEAGESPEAPEAWHAAWLRSSVAERLALCQLERHGFMNPQNLTVARALFARSLCWRPADIAMRRELRLLARRVPPETVARWETTGTPGTWSQLRVPLAAALVGGVIFLVYTKPEFVSTTLSALTAVTAAVPLFLRLFGRTGRDAGQETS